MFLVDGSVDENDDDDLLRVLTLRRWVVVIWVDCIMVCRMIGGIPLAHEAVIACPGLTRPGPDASSKHKLSAPSSSVISMRRLSISVREDWLDWCKLKRSMLPLALLRLGPAKQEAEPLD